MKNLSFERISQIIAKSLNITVEQLHDAFQIAGQDDFEDVIRFRKTFFKDAYCWDDRAYLRWRFDFSTNESDRGNRFWILRVNGEILGVIGLESFELQVCGSRLRASHPLELLAKPSLNGLGIGAWLSMAVARKSTVLVVVGSTGESLNLIKRLFYPVSYYQSWKLAVSAKGTLQRITHSRLIASLGAFLLDGILATRRRMRFARYQDASCRIRPLARFSSEIDDWDQSFSAASNFRRRTSGYLNWRFLDNPRQAYTALGVYRNDMLIAYVIYHLNRSLRNHQTEAVITDIFWKQDPQVESRAMCRCVLTLASQAIITKGAKLIEMKVVGDVLQQALVDTGYSSRGEADIFSIQVNDPALAADLQTKNHWLLTSADAHDDDL